MEEGGKQEREKKKEKVTKKQLKFNQPHFFRDYLDKFGNIMLYIATI